MTPQEKTDLSVPAVEKSVDEVWLAGARTQLSGFHNLLATDGITRGLLGPREGERLWDRHLLNSAAVVDPTIGLVDIDSKVVDIGSGAGLPGLVWALVRPDLSIVLVEPLHRRTKFLHDAIAALNVGDRVSVVRARAQDAGDIQADYVVSRALSSLAQVVDLSRPLVQPGGRILAMKGGRAASEIQDARDKIAEFGEVRLVNVGPASPDGHPLARVVEISGRRDT